MAFKNLKKHVVRFLKYESGKRFAHYYDLVTLVGTSSILTRIITKKPAKAAFLWGRALL